MSSRLGSIYIDGMMSGIDTSGMLRQIAEIRQRPVRLLEIRKTEQTQRLAAYQSLNAMLLGLSTQAAALVTSSGFLSYTATGNNSAALAVTGSANAAPGSYDVVINSLATAQKISSAAVSDATAAMGHEGDIIVNGRTIAVHSGDNLTGLASRVNAAGAGVWATVVAYAEDDQRLVLTSRQTGTQSTIQLTDANADGLLESLGLLGSEASIKYAIGDGARSDGFISPAATVGGLLGLSGELAGNVQINGTAVEINLAEDNLQQIAARISSQVEGVTASVKSVQSQAGLTYHLEIVGSAGMPAFADDNNVLCALGVLVKQPANQLQGAADAQLTVDNVAVSRLGNSISDLIPGVTLDLLKAAPGSPITVTVAQDSNVTYNRVAQLVSSYNAIMDNLQQGYRFDAEAGTSGLYFGDPAVRLLGDGLHGAVMNPLTALGQALNLPSRIGFSTDQNGRLLLDRSTFVAALEDNPVAVAGMFGIRGEASDAGVVYVSSGVNTRPSGAGGYAVHITQPAGRATASSASAPDGISVSETLTFNNTCTVELVAGMSLEEAADTINGRFQLFGFAMRAEVGEEVLVIRHNSYGSRYGFTVRSSLDAGQGGLELGGPTAGQSAQYAGADVAGTINGEQATGNGRYLTGNPGNATTDGLVLRVDAESAGDLGTVTISQGIGARLQSYLARATHVVNGSMSIATSNIADDIRHMDEQIQRLEAGVERYLEKLRADLLAMETALARSESMSQYIANQIKGLTNNYYQRQ